MTRWHFQINLAKEFRAAKEDGANVPALLESLQRQLRVVQRRTDSEYLRGFVDGLLLLNLDWPTNWHESSEAVRQSYFERFNNAMVHLYDWADQNGLWIETIKEVA